MPTDYITTPDSHSCLGWNQGVLFNVGCRQLHAGFLFVQYQRMEWYWGKGFLGCGSCHFQWWLWSCFIRVLVPLQLSLLLSFWAAYTPSPEHQPFRPHSKMTVFSHYIGQQSGGESGDKNKQFWGDLQSTPKVGHNFSARYGWMVDIILKYILTIFLICYDRWFINVQQSRVAWGE